MNDKFSYGYEPIAPLQSLYIGSGPGNKISNDEREFIIAIAANSFPSFTVLNALGYFRGSAEETMVIQIATADTEKLRKLAYQILIEHKQLGVGIVEYLAGEGPIYGRIVPIHE
jgi:hypothetical protein